MKFLRRLHLHLGCFFAPLLLFFILTGWYSPRLFKWLVVIMAVALSVTVILGIILAFRSIRQRWLVWLSLGPGVAFPTLLLWLGQHR